MSQIGDGDAQASDVAVVGHDARRLAHPRDQSKSPLDRRPPRGSPRTRALEWRRGPAQEVSLGTLALAERARQTIRRAQ